MCVSERTSETPEPIGHGVTGEPVSAIGDRRAQELVRLQRRLEYIGVEIRYVVVRDTIAPKVTCKRQAR